MIFTMLSLVALLCFALPSHAQPGGRGNDRLERAGLRIGQAIPQADLYTADGRHLSLSELGGSYTVLIFGCLT